MKKAKIKLITLSLMIGVISIGCETNNEIEPLYETNVEPYDEMIGEWQFLSKKETIDGETTVSTSCDEFGHTNRPDTVEMHYKSIVITYDQNEKVNKWVGGFCWSDTEGPTNNGVLVKEEDNIYTTLHNPHYKWGYQFEIVEQKTDIIEVVWNWGIAEGLYKQGFTVTYVKQ